MQKFKMQAVCIKCGLMTNGILHFDSKLALADSDGGVLQADGWICHNCLGEPFASSECGTYGKPGSGADFIL
jgi:hypothetical protein